MVPLASVTILVLNYKQIKYVTQALESVAGQTLAPKQVIVIDDGSSQQEVERLRSVIKRFPSLNICSVLDGVNLGHTTRMNQALALASEEFFLLLSADDWLEPTALETLSTDLTLSDDVVWGNISVVNEDGSPRGYVRPRENWQGRTARKYLQGGHVFNDLFRVNSFVTGGMSLLRVNTIRNVGGWDSEITTEDFDLWLRIGKTANFRYIDEVIGNYRQVPNSKSRNDNKKLIDQAHIFAKHAGESKELDKKLAYLAAMRWSLAVARLKGLPDVSISTMALIIGISSWKIRFQVLKSIWAPVAGSAIAFFQRSLKVFHRS